MLVLANLNNFKPSRHCSLVISSWMTMPVFVRVNARVGVVSPGWKIANSIWGSGSATLLLVILGVRSVSGDSVLVGIVVWLVVGCGRSGDANGCSSHCFGI